jgi:hypothetical protein
LKLYFFVKKLQTSFISFITFYDFKKQFLRKCWCFSFKRIQQFEQFAIQNPNSGHSNANLEAVFQSNIWLKLVPSKLVLSLWRNFVSSFWQTRSNLIPMWLKIKNFEWLQSHNILPPNSNQKLSSYSRLVTKNLTVDFWPQNVPVSPFNSVRKTTKPLGECSPSLKMFLLEI